MPRIFPSRKTIAPGRIPSGVATRRERKACPRMPEPIVPSRLFQLLRARDPRMLANRYSSFAVPDTAIGEQRTPKKLGSAKDKFAHTRMAITAHHNHAGGAERSMRQNCAANVGIDGEGLP